MKALLVMFYVVLWDQFSPNTLVSLAILRITASLAK